MREQQVLVYADLAGTPVLAGRLYARARQQSIGRERARCIAGEVGLAVSAWECVFRPIVTTHSD